MRRAPTLRRRRGRDNILRGWKTVGQPVNPHPVLQVGQRQRVNYGSSRRDVKSRLLEPARSGFQKVQPPLPPPFPAPPPRGWHLLPGREGSFQRSHSVASLHSERGVPTRELASLSPGHAFTMLMGDPPNSLWNYHRVLGGPCVSPKTDGFVAVRLADPRAYLAPVTKYEHQL